MVKNESAQNWLEPERPDRARLPDSNAANGTQIRLRMRKIFSFKDPPILIKIAKFDFGKKIIFIKKRIFHRIFWEYSVEYSVEYFGEYSLGDQSKGATWAPKSN